MACIFQARVDTSVESCSCVLVLGRTRKEYRRPLTRNEILEHAVRFDMPLVALRLALGRFPWDCEAPLVTLRAADVVAVLDRFLAGQLSADEVTAWADLLEVREDVDFGVTTEDADVVRHAVWLVANPEISLPGSKLDRDNALAIREDLGGRVS